MFKNEDYSVATTQAHRDQSWEMAQASGVNVYLVVLERWLEQYGDEELVISREENDVTGEVKETKRTWPLQAFITSPTAQELIQDVRSIVETHNLDPRGDVVAFLLNEFCDGTMGDVPPQVVVSLKALPDDIEFWLLGAAFRRDSAAFFDDPLTAINRERELSQAD